jgi:hypothetical protein
VYRRHNVRPAAVSWVHVRCGARFTAPTAGGTDTTRARQPTATRVIETCRRTSPDLCRRIRAFGNSSRSAPTLARKAKHSSTAQSPSQSALRSSPVPPEPCLLLQLPQLTAHAAASQPVDTCRHENQGLATAYLPLRVKPANRHPRKAYKIPTKTPDHRNRALFAGD